MSNISWVKSVITKAYASKWDLDIALLKTEHESQIFVQVSLVILLQVGKKSLVHKGQYFFDEH